MARMCTRRDKYHQGNSGRNTFLGFSPLPSIRSSTQLKQLVPLHGRVSIYMLSTYVAGSCDPPRGNRGEPLRRRSKSSPVFPRCLSSPNERTILLLFLRHRFLFLPFSFALFPPFNNAQCFALFSAENKPSQRVPREPGRVFMTLFGTAGCLVFKANAGAPLCFPLVPK